MAFGQELKDFVGGFQAGYKLIDSPDEKKRKAAAETRAQGSYDREGKWHDDAMGLKQDEIKYSRGRDAVGDKRYDAATKRQNANDDWAKFRAGQEDATSETHYQQERKDRNDIEKLKLAPAIGAGNDRQGYVDGLPGPDDAPSSAPAPASGSPNAGAIPDDTADPPSQDNTAPSDESSMATPRAGNSGGYQQASYRDPQVAAVGGGTDTTALQKASSGGVDELNPTGGPQIAAKMVHDLQRDFGVAPHVAVGIVGQLAGETGGFTKLQEENPTVPGSRGGGGYAQWTGSRRNDFEQFAGRANPTTYQENYQFLRNELANTSEGGVLDKLKDAPDAQTAGRIFTDTFLRPDVKNYAGRAHWTDMVGKAYQQLGGGTAPKAVSAAVGGMINAIPDPNDDPNQYGRDAPSGPPTAVGNVAPDSTALPDQGPVPQARPDQSAIPDNVPTPTPRPNYDGTSEGNTSSSDDTLQHYKDVYQAGHAAVLEGLKGAIAATGADMNSAIDDPTLEKARQDMLKGYGAAPQQMMKQVLDKIDPDKKMPPAERNMKAMGYVYDYYNNKGDTAQAKEAATSMVQYYRQASQQFIALSKAAVAHGDMDNAAKAAVAAYTSIPDGQDAKVTKTKDGNFDIEFSDVQSGKTVHKQVVTPEQFGAEIMKFNPNTFTEQLMQAAGIRAQTVKAQTPENTQKTADAVETAAPDVMDKSTLNPERQTLVKDAAADIAGISDNRKAAGEATRFAAGMMAFNADDPKDDSANYTVSKIPGNNDIVKVTMNGDTVIMSAGKVAQIEKARENLAKERSTARTEKDKSDKLSAEHSKMLMDGLSAFGKIGGEITPPEPQAVGGF